MSKTNLAIKSRYYNLTNKKCLNKAKLNGDHFCCFLLVPGPCDVILWKRFFHFS